MTKQEGITVLGMLFLAIYAVLHVIYAWGKPFNRGLFYDHLPWWGWLFAIVGVGLFLYNMYLENKPKKGA